MNPLWLDWARTLQSIAQNGLAFAHDPFDVERYEAIRRVAAEMMAIHTGTETEYVLDLFLHEQGYATPKLDARGAVFQGGRLLFVRERHDGLWTLPGGWIDVGESPSESIVREIYEESGYLTRAVKLLALYDRDKHGHPPLRHHVYRLFFLCEILGGAPTHSTETEGVAFFGEDDVPELSLSRVTPGQIARLFEHYRHPEWPTDFD